MSPQRKSQIVMVVYFLSIFVVSALLIGWLLLPFLSILILAAVVTGFFKPIHDRLSDLVTRRVSSFLTCCLIFILLFLPIVFFVGVVSREAYNLYLMARGAALGEHLKALMDESRLVESVNSLTAPFGLMVTGDTLRQAITEMGRFVGLFLYEQASAIASNVLAFLVNFFLMLLVIYFLLIDGGRLIDFIVDLSPLPREQDEKLIRKFKDMAGAILLGNGACGVLQGAAGGLIFAAAGLESAFLWGVVMAILAFLPIIGIGAVFVPASVYLFLKGRFAAGIWLFLVYVIVVVLVEYIFKPKLVGDRVQMHALLVFLSMIGGLRLFGILGIIYGPLVATAFLTLTDIYHTSYQIILEPPDKTYYTDSFSK
jgi:predicted PurR-regulated permease PerM